VSKPTQSEPLPRRELVRIRRCCRRRHGTHGLRYVGCWCFKCISALLSHFAEKNLLWPKVTLLAESSWFLDEVINRYHSNSKLCTLCISELLLKLWIVLVIVEVHHANDRLLVLTLSAMYACRKWRWGFDPYTFSLLRRCWTQGNLRSNHYRRDTVQRFHCGARWYAKNYVTPGSALPFKVDIGNNICCCYGISRYSNLVVVRFNCLNRSELPTVFVL